MPSTKLSSPRNEMTGNERSLYPCLFRARQACTRAVNKYLYNLKTKHKNKLFNLHFTFKHVIWLSFASFQNIHLVASLFILNSHEPGPGPNSRVPDWLRRSEVKVFVSLCSYSTCRCVRGSEQIGIETVVKNNSEWIIKCYGIGVGYKNVWR